MLRTFTRVAPAALLALASANAQTPAERIARTADSLAGMRLADGVAGLVVGVYVHERPVFERAYGSADDSAGRAMTTTQPIDVASITQQVTAAAVLRLVDEGRVSLDAPLARYVPDAGDALGAVTIRQLLNHTSGVGRLADAADGVLPVLRAAPAEFAPGARFAFNDANYWLLGRVIERVSGIDWESYVVRAFFVPLGMFDTRACPPDRGTWRTDGGLPTGYVVTNGARVAAPSRSAVPTDAAGGLCSTARDLARWSDALHGGRVLSPTSYAAMTTPPALVTPTQYGMGALVTTVSGHRKLWLDGSLASGFDARLAHYPDDSLTVVVLTNSVPARPHAMEAALFRAWVGSPARAPHAAATTSTRVERE